MSQLPKSNVNHPDHYNQGGIECIDAMLSAYGEESVINFCIGNVFKYIWRFKSKNGLEDLNKADWYLDKVIDILEKSDNKKDSSKCTTDNF